MRLLTFALNALWEETCQIENGSSFPSFGPGYVTVFLKSSVLCNICSSKEKYYRIVYIKLSKVMLILGGTNITR